MSSEKLNDPIWRDNGWNKMQQIVNGVNVHYMAQFYAQGKMTTVIDFKFKDPDSLEKKARKEALKAKNKKMDAPIKKYVIANDKDYTLEEHAKFTYNNKLPYIIVTRKGIDISEVFYNVVELGLDDEKISEDMKTIFESYSKFCLMPYYLYEKYLTENYYFIRFPIYNKHVDCFVNQLFDYLNSGGDLLDK